ncbi:MAG TPA: hypothetical protein VNM16_00800 [Bacillota bacterium]|nr:hypothetical protein [Bacillota bacterium]
MPEAVYRVVTLLCAVVQTAPIGTNLGLVEVLWMLVSGRLLATRGALIPGLAETGLPDAAVRRAWAAVGHGAWTSERLIKAWAAQVAQEQRWQASCYGGYRPVAVDVTAFWRPRLRNCPTRHYSAEAGKALPAIPLGIIARIGRVGSQRLGVLVRLVRADPSDPSPGAHRHALLRSAVACCAADEAVVVDREFGVAEVHAAGAPAFVARLRKNFTARRAAPPPYRGRGRPPIHGALVRPLARRRGARQFPATPADRVTSWEEGGGTIRAEQWDDLVLPDAPANAPTFSVIAVFDPRYHDPLLLATPLPLSPQATRDLYRDRWPVEQLPLAAKQMLGAARQFVHEKETCQRLPELSLLAGSVLSYVAATGAAVPVGFWDRRPQPTPGRLRRLLMRCLFPQDFPWPEHIRQKAAATDHLPKGASAHHPASAREAA